MSFGTFGYKDMCPNLSIYLFIYPIQIWIPPLVHAVGTSKSFWDPCFRGKARDLSKSTSNAPFAIFRSQPSTTPSTIDMTTNFSPPMTKSWYPAFEQNGCKTFGPQRSTQRTSFLSTKASSLRTCMKRSKTCCKRANKCMYVGWMAILKGNGLAKYWTLFRCAIRWPNWVLSVLFVKMAPKESFLCDWQERRSKPWLVPRIIFQSAETATKRGRKDYIKTI